MLTFLVIGLVVAAVVAVTDAYTERPPSRDQSGVQIMFLPMGPGGELTPVFVP